MACMMWLCLMWPCICGLHDMAMLCAGVYCVSMYGMDVPGGKKPIFSAYLRKNHQIFPIICR
jgi:hypothetical protein